MDTARSSAGLLLAGLVSGVISVLALSTMHVFYGTGLVFGAIIAAYFALFEEYRGLVRFALFLAVCAASLHAAVFAAIVAMQFTRALDSQQVQPPLFVFAVGGAIGAFMVLMATLLLFGAKAPSWKTLMQVQLGSLGGALLGLLGAVWEQTIAPNRVSVGGIGGVGGAMLLWQPGMALLMGVILNADRSAQE